MYGSRLANRHAGVYGIGSWMPEETMHGHGLHGTTCVRKEVLCILFYGKGLGKSGWGEFSEDDGPRDGTIAWSRGRPGCVRYSEWAGRPDFSGAVLCSGAVRQ